MPNGLGYRRKRDVSKDVLYNIAGDGSPERESTPYPTVFDRHFKRDPRKVMRCKFGQYLQIAN